MAQKRVLIVDDSSLARMMMRNNLTKNHPEWEILEAKEGAEALNLVRATEIDLALIDYNMPGLNGIDLATQLMEQQPSVSIHLVTANIQDRMRQRAEALGVGFIMKPITEDKLAGVVHELEG
ncbi:response regulator receiver protein [Magnetococcus marinus MC-1]|uniref:Response regulator receiver protein n=1 Tax=Magnetococcus marinus (strain ATCC BAA-1437 / JCM 17883 / MC-1) TaxID=156889 RepID=A0L9Z2_MAGMM|nr:response regulator [Magnetococcus marinus]ABK44785.1 response regulator receiver protein [Magnetococcus marinus MC-1]